MHAAVGRSIRFPLKANFADGSVLRDERWHMVLRTLAMRYQIEHRIFWLAELVGRVLRIRHQKTARPTDGRLLMADGTLAAVKSLAQPLRIRQGCQGRIFSSHAAERHVTAIVP